MSKLDNEGTINCQTWIDHHTRDWTGPFYVYWPSAALDNKYMPVIDPDHRGDFWYKGGHLRWAMYFENGKRVDGISYGWYPSGQFKQIMHWKNNLKDGPELRFFPNGQTQDHWWWVEGKEHGVWSHWDWIDEEHTVAGLTIKKEYHYGKLIWQEKFNKDGTTKKVWSNGTSI